MNNKLNAPVSPSQLLEVQPLRGAYMHMLHHSLKAVVHVGACRWDHKCVSGFDRRRTYLSAFLFATETQQTIGAPRAQSQKVPVLQVRQL